MSTAVTLWPQLATGMVILPVPQPTSKTRTDRIPKTVRIDLRMNCIFASHNRLRTVAVSLICGRVNIVKPLLHSHFSPIPPPSTQRYSSLPHVCFVVLKPSRRQVSTSPLGKGTFYEPKCYLFCTAMDFFRSRGKEGKSGPISARCPRCGPSTHCNDDIPSSVLRGQTNTIKALCYSPHHSLNGLLFMDTGQWPVG